MRHSEYLEELSSADVFVQPGVIADNGDTKSGGPTTILEAQACGVPVISTTRGHPQ
jgi:glycosyltransferase involved in cell wall biosynthesis